MPPKKKNTQLTQICIGCKKELNESDFDIYGKTNPKLRKRCRICTAEFKEPKISEVLSPEEAQIPITLPELMLNDKPDLPVVSKEIKLHYNPYPKQVELHKCVSRYRAVCCGRRSGKTFAGVFEFLNCIKKHGDNPERLSIGWVAPSYQNALRGIATFKKIGRELIANKLVKVSSTSPFTIDLNGHKVYFLTADNPDGIRGFYFDFLIIDEAAYVSDSVYYDVLKPTLMDKSGKLFAISTPQGKRGFFYELFLRGLDENVKDVSSFTWSTYENPYIKTEDIEEMKQTLPELTYKQEVLAQFIASDNQVFTEVSNCHDKKHCHCDCKPVIGCDLAKKHDYTVMISICPECLTVKSLYRNNHIPWGEQQVRIVAEYNHQRAKIIYVDATGIGDVVIDNLKNSNLKIEPIIFTNASKNKMMNDLIVNIEQGKLRWDNDEFGVITEELLCLERIINKNSVGYGAALNGHDDVVMALALGLKAALECKEYSIFSVNSVQDNGLQEELIENDMLWQSF